MSEHSDLLSGGGVETALDEALVDHIAKALFDAQVFAGAFWVFVGIVAGALIQFGFHWLILRSQRANAKKLFLAEIELNSAALDAFEADVKRKKDKFVADQIDDMDFYFNCRDFNYRIVDPLINSGHFHAILGPNGVKDYFESMNALNVQAAENMQQMLRVDHENHRSVKFFEWLLETGIPRWRGILASTKTSSKKS